jgi:phenylacetate-coenzyme A ligase PaaK-like adenylate-forming protein
MQVMTPGHPHSTAEAARLSPPLASREAALWCEVAWDGANATQLRPIDLIHRAERRLHEQIAFARQHTALYRRRYAHLPASPSLRPGDLPPLAKRELMADLGASLSDHRLTQSRIEAFIADPARVGELLDDRYAVWTSSGSTGQPATYLHDRDALAVYQALEMFRFRGLASSAHLAARLMGGERCAMVAATGGHFAGIAAIEHLRRSFPWLSRSVRAFSLLQPLESLVAQLNAFQPTVLSSYPTAADVLSGEQEAGRLRLRLAELWTGGETLSESVRERVRRRFGCRVRNAYGSSEFLSIAWDCERGCLHVNADWVWLEAVDAQYRPVPPGSVSHTTLLTNLVNRVQPLLRYDIGDAITLLAQPCPCGCALPAIRVEGRHDDILVFPARDRPPVQVLPLVLATVLEDHALVHDFQAVQVGPRRLQIRLGGAERADAQRVRGELSEFLHALGADRVVIEVTDGAPLPCPRSGKLRRVLHAPRRERRPRSTVGAGI